MPGESKKRSMTMRESLMSAWEAAVRKREGEADMRRMADPIAGMSGTEKFLAGAGKSVSNVLTGLGQVAGIGDSAEEVDEMKRRDAPLMRTGAGVAGNIAGYAPLMFVPGANTYGGAAMFHLGMACACSSLNSEADHRMFNDPLSRRVPPMLAGTT